MVYPGDGSKCQAKSIQSHLYPTCRGTTCPHYLSCWSPLVQMWLVLSLLSGSSEFWVLQFSTSVTKSFLYFPACKTQLLFVIVISIRFFFFFPCGPFRKFLPDILVVSGGGGAELHVYFSIHYV